MDGDWAAQYLPLGTEWELISSLHIRLLNMFVIIFIILFPSAPKMNRIFVLIIKFTLAVQISN